MRCRIGTIVAIFAMLVSTSAHCADALLEVGVGGDVYVGRSLQYDQQTCWLLMQDGRVHLIPLDSVTSYRKVSDAFRPIAPSALRSRLRDELGREYEVRSSSEFVIAAPQGQAQPYAELLDDVYRSFVRYFSRRNMRLSEPEVPLVAIVFADVNQFADYCRQDNVRYSSTLLGYYHPRTNRIALYDPGDGLSAQLAERKSELALISPECNRVPQIYARPASIRAGLRDTLVHETTHQLAFNMGLHTRIGENPKWVVEGLALICEQQLSARSRGPQSTEVNEYYYGWFNSRVRPDWEPGTLRQFLASDRPFTTETLNSYSLAWALTYYLSGRRSAEFAAYLQSIRQRDVSGGYPSEDRLSDFQQAFGDDIDWLEVELLRYIDGLED